LNYTLSSSWAYFHTEKIKVLGQERPAAVIVGGIIVIELMAGYLSKAFSKRIDSIPQPKLRMPGASLMYLLPVLPLYLISSPPMRSDVFVFVLIAATSLFRTAHASVFGTLNAVGQLLIESDERRATLLSMSSALASFIMALALIVIKNSRSFQSVEEGLQFSWMYLTLPCILMLAGGGYLVAHRVKN
jgi:hypothetical protein